MDEVIHDIAAIPGDGIGNEVVPAARRVLEAAGARHGFGFRWTDYDWGCERYLETGAMMPEDGLDRLRAPPRHLEHRRADRVERRVLARPQQPVEARH